jgi:xanthine dehydrogenase accessory factor
MRLDTLAALNAECSARRPCALVTNLASGEQRLVPATDIAADPLADSLAERLQLGKSGMATLAGEEFFIQVHAPTLRLVAIGAVHIAQALAPIAKHMGFEMVIVDPRSGFATSERFPDARLIVEWPETALPHLRLDRRTAMILFTHEPRIDDPALVQALRADCIYIGALGSQKSHAQRLERMRAAGFDERQLARIHAPIGLDIGAESPAEIAIAILGEIIASQRRKPLRAEVTKAA